MHYINYLDIILASNDDVEKGNETSSGTNNKSSEHHMEHMNEDEEMNKKIDTEMEDESEAVAHANQLKEEKEGALTGI